MPLSVSIPVPPRGFMKKSIWINDLAPGRRVQAPGLSVGSAKLAATSESVVILLNGRSGIKGWQIRVLHDLAEVCQFGSIRA